MTWTLKVRSNPGSTVTADYECPVHGRFTAIVPRDTSGDPPPTMRCEEIDEICHDCAEPPCSDCGAVHWQCDEMAPFVMSAPGHVKVRAGEVVRGRSAERPADRYVMDTRPLADGMPLEEFKKRRAAVHRDESLRRVRKAFGKTPKVWSR